MKITIEIPAELYRQVNAKCRFERRTVREVTEDVYRRWLAEGRTPSATAAGHWLEDWIAMADKTMRSAPPDSTARDLLAEDRKRMERP